ncbi:MAG: (d)CMP kinase [Clostridia bacterium]|nr:(d)CMP kinase [Clostridia bacterium]
MTKTINIAIDGPSGSGKSTLAKMLAASLGYVYIDTGALYRTVGLFAMQNGISAETPEDVVPLLDKLDLQMRLEDGGNAVYLNGAKVGAEIRTSEASVYASQVSKVPAVRAFLLDTQRSIAKQNNVIMDGRDIGTVILPDAQVKIYMSASPEQRAKRRLAELVAKGEDITFEQVLADIKWRDENDANRDIAPAKPAEDAVFLDNSDLTLDGLLQAALEIVSNAIGATA